MASGQQVPIVVAPFRDETTQRSHLALRVAYSRPETHRSRMEAGRPHGDDIGRDAVDDGRYAIPGGQPAMRDFSLDVDAHREIAGEGALGLLHTESNTDQIPSAEPLPFGLGRRLPGA